MQRQFGWRQATALLLFPLVVMAVASTAQAQFGPAPGQVFTSTNAAAGNDVVVFTRGTDGSLLQGNGVATGGLGSGDSLGSQGAICLTVDLQWLLVVNAGSSDVSVFQVTGNGLTLTDREPSGGTRPVSVAAFGSLVYVLNAGSPNSVSGFTLSGAGDLAPIAGATSALSAAQTMPAQVGFSPDGNWLVVTEKMTDLIDVWPVNANGTLGTVAAQASSGVTPFGFAFRGSQLIVSEAFMGATDASAVTSYGLGSGGALSTITGSAPTTETAACWIAFPNNMLWAYTTNTGSDSVTGYFVAPSGTLTILDGNGVTATTGSMPTDLAFGRDTRYLFVLNSGAASISSFRIAPGGALAPLGPAVGTLPAMTTTGLAAY